ncbi:MAG TPA: hypothetical protein VMW72_03130 [Sedimentisphaerales bacterium]|nr:hypothetical protein [Sedimentisphaerales bacterium]
MLDNDTGNIITTLAQGYKCTRFTLSEPYLLGSNMDVYDLSDVDNCLRSQLLHTRHRKKWVIARRLPIDSRSQGVYLNLYR